MLTSKNAAWISTNRFSMSSPRAFEEDGFGAAGRESDFGIRPGVADHHLIEQAAQLLRGLRLPGPLPVDKSLAKFLRGRKASRIKELTR
jgi:hypothetical protein